MWGPHVSGLTVYGTGQPYGHISGAATYDASSGLWTVTGAATVDIAAETGAAVLMARGIVVDGGVLTVPAKCMGQHLYLSTGLWMRNGAHLHMDKIGLAGDYGDVTPLSLLPAACRGLVNQRQLASWIIRGRGAEGAARNTAQGAGLPGNAAATMQTGGGASGAHGWWNTAGTWSGKGGCGGPFCGGAGSGASYGTNSDDAGDFGGPGTDGLIVESHATMSGGAGDPGGEGAPDTYDHVPAPVAAPQGGGLLSLLALHADIGPDCMISADGAPSTTAEWGGGCTGGGCILIVTAPGGYNNLGTVRAAGGVSLSIYGKGGPGGAGSVNRFTA